MAEELPASTLADSARAGSRGGLATIAFQASAAISQLVGLVVLGRLLEPTDYGTWAVALSLGVFASAVVLMGLPMAVAQAPHLSDGARTWLFLLSTALGLAAGAALLAVAPRVATLYGNPALESAMAYAALLPAAAGLQSQFRLELVRRHRYVALGTVDLVAQIIATATAITLATLGFGVQALAVQIAVQCLVQVLLAAGMSEWRPGAVYGLRAEVLPVLRVGLDVLGQTMLREGSRALLLPLAGLRLSVPNLGAVDRGQQLYLLPITLGVDQLQRVAIPLLSEQRGRPEFVTLLRGAQLAILYWLCPAYLILAVLAPSVVAVVLGDQWRVAGTVLQILALSGGFRALGQSMQWLFIASGNSRAGLVFASWSQPLLFALSAVGLVGGLHTFLVTTAIAWTMSLPLAAIFALRCIDESPTPFAKDVLRVHLQWCFPAAVSAFVAVRLGAGSDWRMLAFGVIGAAIGAALSYVTFRGVRRDLRRFVHLLRRDA